MDTDLAQNEHNYQFATSLEVLQKIKSENNLKNNRHDDDSVDVMLRIIELKQNHPYIKRFSTPFTTYLGIDEQIKLLKAYKHLFLHFDATGSLVRKPDKNSKRVNYYAGVVNINNKILPILEMITNDQTASNIAECLTYFKRSWIQSGEKWPAFKGIVIDWCWASINAVMISWNNLSVQDYLIKTFDRITSNKQLEEQIIPVFLCYGHFMKMISRYLHTTSKKNVIMFVLEVMAVLVHCQNYTIFKNTVGNIFKVLIFKKINEVFLKSLNEINVTQTEQQKN